MTPAGAPPDGGAQTRWAAHIATPSHHRGTMHDNLLMAPRTVVVPQRATNTPN